MGVDRSRWHLPPARGKNPHSVIGRIGLFAELLFPLSSAISALSQDKISSVDGCECGPPGVSRAEMCYSVCLIYVVASCLGMVAVANRESGALSRAYKLVKKPWLILKTLARLSPPGHWYPPISFSQFYGPPYAVSHPLAQLFFRTVHRIFFFPVYLLYFFVFYFLTFGFIAVFYGWCAVRMVVKKTLGNDF